MVRLTKGYKEVVPVILHEYHQQDGRGYFQVHYDSLLDKMFFWLFRKPRTGKIYMDAMSTKTVSLIDGRRTIGEIAYLLSESGEDMEPEELSRRVAMFLGNLHQRRFVELKREKNSKNQ